MSGAGRAAEDEDRTRQAWERASEKHEREYDDLLRAARTARLAAVEHRLLAGLLEAGPEVLHPQSGHGLDDAALVHAGARSVVGVDYSTVAVGAAARRADELGLPIRYLVERIPPLPADDASFDLVYTGRGALIWLPDLTSWAREAARVLRPGGSLFVHEAHPLVPLWTWDEHEPGLRQDRSYFAPEHENDTFPSNGAMEQQHTLAEIVMSVVRAGFELVDLVEHPEPFWRPDGVAAAAWEGALPNSFSLLARTPVATTAPEGDAR